MTTGLMRRFSSSARTQVPRSTSFSLAAPRLLGLKQYQRSITDVRPRQASVSRSWFTSTSPCAYPELDEHEQKRLNERNLKLGNSMANVVLYTVAPLTVALQPSGSSTTAYRTSSTRRCPQTSSRRRSASSCSPRHTPICPPSAESSHTPLRYGQPPSHGVECP